MTSARIDIDQTTQTVRANTDRQALGAIAFGAVVAGVAAAVLVWGDGGLIGPLLFLLGGLVVLALSIASLRTTLALSPEGITRTWWGRTTRHIPWSEVQRLTLEHRSERTTSSSQRAAASAKPPQPTLHLRDEQTDPLRVGGKPVPLAMIREARDRGIIPADVELDQQLQRLRDTSSTQQQPAPPLAAGHDDGPRGTGHTATHAGGDSAGHVQPAPSVSGAGAIIAKRRRSPLQAVLAGLIGLLALVFLAGTGPTPFLLLALAVVAAMVASSLGLLGRRSWFVVDQDAVAFGRGDREGTRVPWSDVLSVNLRRHSRRVASPRRRGALRHRETVVVADVTLVDGRTLTSPPIHDDQTTARLAAALTDADLTDRLPDHVEYGPGVEDPPELSLRSRLLGG